MQKIESVKKYYRTNPVTFTLLSIIIVYFIVMSLNGGTTNNMTLLKFGALYPPAVLAYGQYYRLITSIFIHIGIMHLYFNSYALYVFGTQIERIMGAKKYIAFFLLSGIGGNIVTFIFSFDSLSAGASGSLFGILGAFLYLIRHHKNMITAEGRKSILRIIGINLVITLLIPNISVTAHFVGLAIGYLLAFIFIK